MGGNNSKNQGYYGAYGNYSAYGRDASPYAVTPYYGNYSGGSYGAYGAYSNPYNQFVPGSNPNSLVRPGYGGYGPGFGYGSYGVPPLGASTVAAAPVSPSFLPYATTAPTVVGSGMAPTYVGGYGY
mmetsp:Transcript_129415/g.182459  ORF Transcript_129415/g.182459 Transcript_129415/m.182459 type:complete len:126 (+) Transcript_129415:39-416(+)